MGSWGFPGGSVVKNPPAMQESQETKVWSLGQEDPLEEGTATHFSIHAWRIPWTEEPGGLQSMGSRRVRYNWSDLAHTHCWQHLLLGGTAPARHPELICRPPPDTHRLQRYTALSLRDAHFFLLRLHLAMVLNELLFAVLHAAHRRIILYHLRHQGSPGKNILVFSFKKKTYLFFIYLAAPSLSCGMWDLRASFRHAGSLVAAY